MMRNQRSADLGEARGGFRHSPFLKLWTRNVKKLYSAPTVIFALSVQAADWFVSPSGDDGAAGTQQRPWLTLDYALGKVSPGDTIHLGPGAYPDSAGTRVSGTANSPITITGPANSEAIIGPGRLTIEHSYYVIQYLHVRSNYLALVGTNCSNNVIQSNVFSWAPQGIYMKLRGADGSGTNGPSYNVCIANTFSNLVGNGAVVTLGASNVVSSNLFVDLNGYDALRVWGVGTRISDNRFQRLISGTEAGHENHADVIQTFSSASNGLWAVGVVFERNTLVECTSQFGNLEAQYGNPNLRDWIFRNNLFINSRLQMNNYIPNVSFYNNTAISNVSSLGFRFAISETKGQAHNGRVFNNIFVRCNGVYSFADGLTNCVADYNLLTGLSDEAKDVPAEGPHGINGNYTPSQIFRDVTQQDFRLTTNSPARGAGVLPWLFLSAVNAPTNYAYDVGAYVNDVMASPARITPPTELRVLP